MAVGVDAPWTLDWSLEGPPPGVDVEPGSPPGMVVPPTAPTREGPAMLNRSDLKPWEEDWEAPQGQPQQPQPEPTQEPWNMNWGAQVQQPQVQPAQPSMQLKPPPPTGPQYEFQDQPDVERRGRLREAGVGLTTSLATLSQQLKQWWYGQRVQDFTQQIEDISKDTDRYGFRNPVPPEERQAQKDKLQQQLDVWREKYGKNTEALNVGEQLTREAMPEHANWIDDVVVSVARSAPTTLAALAVAPLGVPAAVTAGTVGGGLVQAGQATKEAFDKNGIGSNAAGPAALEGIIEGAGESFGIGKGIFGPSKGALLGIARALGYEMTQEGVTQLLQDVVSKVSYDPNLTWKEMGYNAFIATLSGAVTGGIAKPYEMAVTAARERGEKQRLVKDLEKSAFQGMPTAEQEAVRATLPQDFGRLPQSAYASDPYSLGPPPYEATQRAKPPELVISEDLGVKLSPALEEAAKYRQQLEAYGEQAPMPLLPYEVKEQQNIEVLSKAMPEIRSALQAGDIQRAKDVWAQADAQVEQGSISAALLDKVALQLEQPNPDLAGIARGVSLLTQDYITRASTGIPFFGATVGRNFVQPLAHRALTNVQWSSNPEVTGSNFEVPLKGLKQGHAYVLDASKGDLQAFITTARVVRGWVDKMGFKGKLNIAVSPEPDPENAGSLQMSDADTLRLYLKLEANKAGGIGYWSTVAHELGHGLATVMLNRASPKVQAALRRLWAADVRTALGQTTIGEATRQTGGPAAYGADELRQLTSPALAGEYGQGITAEISDYNTYGIRPYIFSYTEWLAHRFERMLTQNAHDMHAEIEAALNGDTQTANAVVRFLHTSWGQLKNLYEAFKSTPAAKRTEADENFDSFVKMHARMQEAESGTPEDMKPAPGPSPYAEQPPAGAAGLTRVATPEQPLPPPAPYTPSLIQFSIAKSTGRPQTPSSRNFDHELDKFGHFRRWFSTLIDLAKANPHIESLARYLDHVFGQANRRMAWVARADLRAREWRRLGKKQADVLTSFLFDQTQAKKYFDMMDPKIQAKYPMTQQTRELYERIKTDFEDFNRAVENQLVATTIQRLSNNPFVQNVVADIRKKFADMRALPYFPMTHFGPYYTLVRNSKGKVVAAPSYDSRAEQKLKKGRLAKAYPGHGLEERQASGIARSLQGVRPEILDALKHELGLTQDQIKALDQYILEIAPGQSFAKHLMQRQGTPGFTRDAIRQYASYFQKGAGFLARAEFGQPMREAINAVQASAKEPGVPDSIKRQRIAEYMKRHYDYLFEPQTEWTAFRSAIAVAMLGAMLPTVASNLTQPVVFTLPYLAARYGDQKAITALAQAYADMPRAFRATKQMDKATAAAYDKWTKGQQLTPVEDKLIQRFTGLDQGMREALLRAQREGIIDQSMAMELAAMAEAPILPLLSQFDTTNRLAYWGRVSAHGLMLPFEYAERINRRTTFMAAYRLAPGTPEQKYIAARDAVNQTQFEYSKWNRPELMRGRKGIMFLFMQYQLSALRFLFGGDPGWWRALALLLMVGGLEGLPFAQDLMNLATWMLSGDNKRIDTKKWIKDHLAMLGGIFEDHPDLLMQGISRYTGPADMSGPMSLGRLMPGAEVLARPGKWDQKLLALERDVGGVFTGLVLNTFRALTDSSLPPERRVELGMPVRFIKQMLIAERWLDKSAVETLSGADIAEATPSDVAMKALGFTPRHINQAMEDLQTKNDFVTFYTMRRAQLSTDYDRAVQTGDKDTIDAAKDAIRKYNEEVPVVGLRINPGDVVRSHIEREKARRAEEAGRGKTRVEKAIQRGLDRDQLQ